MFEYESSAVIIFSSFFLPVFALVPWASRLRGSPLKDRVILDFRITRLTLKENKVKSARRFHYSL